MEDGGGGCPGPAASLRADRGQHDGQNHLTTEGEAMRERQKNKKRMVMRTDWEVELLHVGGAVRPKHSGQTFKDSFIVTH